MVYNNNGEAKSIKRGVPLLHRYILEERRRKRWERTGIFGELVLGEGIVFRCFLALGAESGFIASLRRMLICFSVVRKLRKDVKKERRVDEDYLHDLRMGRN